MDARRIAAGVLLVLLAVAQAQAQCDSATFPALKAVRK